MTGIRSKYLILDDNAADVELAFFDFKENGMDIDFHVSVNAKEALTYLFAEDKSLRMDPPKAIFLDLHMPKISGIQFLQIIKQHPDAKRIPVVVLLSSEDPREIEECRQSGVKIFIQKPLDYKNFVTAIEKIDKHPQ